VPIPCQLLHNLHHVRYVRYCARETATATYSLPTSPAEPGQTHYLASPRSPPPVIARAAFLASARWPPPRLATSGGKAIS